MIENVVHCCMPNFAYYSTYASFHLCLYCLPQHTSSQNQITQLELHHYYGSSQICLAKLWDWYYHHICMHLFPDLLVNSLARHPELSCGSWPEGFTLRGELCWGKMERVFGAS